MAADNEINDVILYASAARTATPTAFNQQDNRFATGIVFTVSCTAVSGSSSVVFTLEGYDVASATWYTILASAAVVSAAVTTYYVFRGATVTTNVSANKLLPRTWRIKPVHGTADSTTYSVGATMIYN